MEPVIEYISILCATCLFVEWAAPIQFIKEALNIAPESNPSNIPLQLLQALVNCCLCSGFWIGVIYYYFQKDGFQVILMGFLTSVGSEWFYRLTNFIYWKLSGGK